MATRRVVLTKDVILKGHGHCTTGSHFDMPESEAYHLVGAKCAEFVDAEEDGPKQQGVRVVQPEHADPAPKRVQGPAPAKVKRAPEKSE